MAGKNTNVEIELRLLKQQFDQALKETRGELKRTQDEFKWSGEQTKHFANESDRLTSTLQKSTQQFQTQSEGLQQLKNDYNQLVEAGQEHTATGQQMAATIEEQTHEYNRMANQLYEAQVANTAYHSTLGTVGRGMDTVGTKMQTAGQAVSGFAQHLLPAALGVAALGKEAYGAFTGFESSLIGVQKTTNESAETMQRFGEQVRELAKVTPHTAEEINRVAEVGGQLGISIQNLLPFAQTMLDLSVTTNLTLEEGSIKLAQLANVMRMPEEQFRNMGSALVDLGNNYATMEDDIVSMSHRLAGAGRLIGLSVGEVMGLSTAAAQTGVRVESGGSNLSKTLLELQLATELASGEMKDADPILSNYGTTMDEVRAAMDAGGEAMEELRTRVGMSEDEFETLTDLVSGNIVELEDWAKAAGMSAEQFAAAFQEDAAQAFVALIENIAQMEQQGQSAAVTLDELGVRNVRQRDVLLRLVGSYDKLGEAVEMGNRAFEENTALTTEAELRYGSMESQMQMVKNRINDTMIEIGSRLAPVLLEMMDYVDRGIAAWDGLSDSTKDFIVQAGALLAIGTPVLFTVGRLTAGVGGLIKGLGGGALSLATFFAKLKVGAPLTVAVSNAMGPASAKIAALGTAAGGAAGTGGAAAGVAGLLKGLTAVAAPWIAPAIAAGAGGFLAYKHATADALKEVDLFADKVEQTIETTDRLGGSVGAMGGHVRTEVTKISEETKTALGAFMAYSDEINLELQKLFVVDDEVTQERQSSIASLMEQEKELVLTGERTKQEERMRLMHEMFENSRILADHYEEQLLEEQRSRDENELGSIAHKYDLINGIVLRALRQKRELTVEEELEIQRLREEIEQQGIDSLSQTEEEKIIIQDRMNEYGKRRTAEQLGEILRMTNESYEQQIEAAQTGYDQMILETERMYRAGEITEEVYQDMKAAAAEAKSSQISEAEEMMIGVLEQLKEKNPELINEVDLANGEIKSNWQKLKEKLLGEGSEINGGIDDVIEKHKELKEQADHHLHATNQKAQRYRRNTETNFSEADQYVNHHIGVLEHLNSIALQNKSATYSIHTNYTYHHTAPTGRMPGRASYAGGIDFIPYSGMVAQLHYGERVLTRAENEKFSMVELEEVSKLVKSVQDAVKNLDERQVKGTVQNRVDERPLPVVTVNLEHVEITNDDSYEEVSYRLGKEVARALMGT